MVNNRAQSGDAPPMPPPACPRCGYDLTGAASAWPDHQCPLRGLCSECGYEFHWADLLNPRNTSIPWLFEHARRRILPQAAVQTLYEALWTPRFWRRVRPHHPINIRRLCLWPLATLTMIALVIAVASLTLQFIYFVLITSGGVSPPTPTWHFHLYGVQPIIRAYSIMTQQGLLVTIAASLLFTLGALAIAAAAPSSLRLVRLRRAHVLRIAIYALAWPLFIQLIVCVVWACLASRGGFPPLSAIGELRWHWTGPGPPIRALPMIELHTGCFTALALCMCSWLIGLRRGLDLSLQDTARYAAACFTAGLLAVFAGLTWAFALHLI